LANICIIEENKVMNEELVQHGSFAIAEWDGKYLFLERELDGLLDIPGGGFGLTEIN
jgi:hypothetical protein